MKVGEAIVVVKGDTDPLQKSLHGAQTKTRAAADKMKKALLPVGLALTAVGVAGLKMVDMARKMNAQLSVTALSLGITTKEMRSLALETTNVTFPLKEVIATFDLLARAGVKDTKTLKDTATAFDTLGDALGMSASQVTEIMVPAMKTFRLSAEEIASKTDIMTFMIRNGTTSLEDFNTMVGYTSQDMVKAGLTIDDLAIAMMFMSDSGVEPGKVMLREWNKAVTQSEKDNISMTEALGMTSIEYENYNEKLKGAVGLTDEIAALQNEQFGIMAKLKSQFEKLTLSVGSFLTPLEPMLAGMTALGPLMIGLSTNAGMAAVKFGLNTIALVANKIAIFAVTTATKAAFLAQLLWNTAMKANPIGLIIAGIVLLVGGIILLVKNWDKAAEFMGKAMNKVKLLFLQGIEKILGGLSKFASWIPGFGKKIQQAHDAIADMIAVEEVKRDTREVEKLAEKMTETVREEIEERRDAALDALDETRKATEVAHSQAITDLRSTYGVLEQEDDSYQATKLEAARNATEAFREQYDVDVDNARDATNKKIELIDEEFNARIKLLDEQTQNIISDFQRQIDAISDQTKAEDRIITEANRERRLDELQAAVDSAKTDDDRLKAIARLEDETAKITRARLLETRQAEKDALRDKIEDVRKAAVFQRNVLADELSENKKHEESLLAETVNRLKIEQGRLDDALKEELLRIDNERIAFEKAEDDKLDATLGRLDEELFALVDHYSEQLTEAQLHVAAINAATAELKDRTVTVTIVERRITEAPLDRFHKIESLAGGGQPPIIRMPLPSLPAPILLGKTTANITIMLDGRTIAKAIAQPLVDEIRISTGVHF